jgi:hypothetical protein
MDGLRATRIERPPTGMIVANFANPETRGPGLALTPEIVVDQRTILDVVLDPIRRVKRGFSIGE